MNIGRWFSYILVPSGDWTLAKQSCEDPYHSQQSSVFLLVSLGDGCLLSTEEVKWHLLKCFPFLDCLSSQICIGNTS